MKLSLYITKLSHGERHRCKLVFRNLFVLVFCYNAPPPPPTQAQSIPPYAMSWGLPHKAKERRRGSRRIRVGWWQRIPWTAVSLKPCRHLLGILETQLLTPRRPSHWRHASVGVGGALNQSNVWWGCGGGAVLGGVRRFPGWQFVLVGTNQRKGQLWCSPQCLGFIP